MNEKIKRRTGGVADHRAVGCHLAGGRRADRAEDAGANHRADREHDQIAGAQHALQRARIGFVDHQVGDGLPLKQLIHTRVHSTSAGSATSDTMKRLGVQGSLNATSSPG